jgi:biopolymer transport protein ExbD
MTLKREKRSPVEAPGASSDIAFLLIIYFIVIAGFNINKGFLMTLPARNSTRFILKEDLLRFELDREGGVLFQGEALDYAGAEGIIRSAAAEHPNLAVVLTVPPEAPWQGVVSFVELAQRLEVDSFSFAMAEPETRGALP